MALMLLASAARSADHRPPAATTAPAAPTAPPAAAPQAPPGEGGELQPVVHAERAGITTCLDTIARQSAAAIDGPHAAVSSWTSTAPNQNLFVSVVGLSHPGPLAPNAGAIIIAAPLGAGRCAGTVVKIIPSARSCSAIQATLVGSGKTIAILQGLPVVDTKSGVRNLLLPTAGGGCTLVAIAVQE